MYAAVLLGACAAGSDTFAHVRCTRVLLIQSDSVEIVLNYRYCIYSLLFVKARVGELRGHVCRLETIPRQRTVEQLCQLKLEAGAAHRSVRTSHIALDRFFLCFTFI